MPDPKHTRLSPAMAHLNGTYLPKLMVLTTLSLVGGSVVEGSESFGR